MRLTHVFLLVALSLSVLAQVTPTGGDQANLPPSCDSPRILRIALTTPEPFDGEEEPVVAEVRYAGVPDEALAKAIQPRWLRGEDGTNVVALELSFGAAIQRQGLYTVSIVPQPVSNPKFPVIVLKVTQPAAELAARPVSLQRFVFIPGWPAAASIALEETSRNACAHLTGATMWDGEQGTLALPAPLPNVAAGTSTEITTTLENLPSGDVSKTLRLRSPELPAPLNVELRVSTKWHWLVLLVAVGLGLLASYLLNTRLQKKVDLGSAVEKARELLAELQTQLARVGDKRFREPLIASAAALDLALDKPKRTEIEAKHKALADLLKAKTEALNGWMKTAEENRVAFAAAIAPDYRVPESIRTAIEQARNSLGEVKQSLDGSNPEDAEKRLAELHNGLASAIRAAYGEWDKVVNSIQGLAILNAGLPAEVTAQVGEAVKALPAGWTAIATLPSPPSSAAIAATLNDYAGKYVAVNALLSSVALRLESEWLDVTRMLAPVRAHFPDAAAFEDLEEAWQAFQSKLRNGAQPGGNSLEITETALGNLQQHWTDGLLKQVPQPPANLPLLIEQRKFREAAKELAAELTKRARIPGVILGTTPSTLPDLGWKPATPALAATPGLTLPLSTLSILNPIVVAPWQSALDAATRARAVQSVFLFVIIGIMLTQDAWTANQGQFGDLVSAFLAAFAADITLETLRTRAAGKATS